MSLYKTESFVRRYAAICEELSTSPRGWMGNTYGREFYDLYNLPSVLHVLGIIHGPEISNIGGPALRTKLPGSIITSFPWHQDSQYYGGPTQHLHVVSVWIPLVDVDEYNGCLYVLPGSHTWGLLKGKRGADNLMITSEDVEKRAKPTALPMSQGDILFFSNLTFHSSKPNSTDKVRWSVDLRYVVPPLAATPTEQQQQGYDTLDTHYGVAPITVRSRRTENVASLVQLQEFASQYSALRTAPRKNS